MLNWLWTPARLRVGATTMLHEKENFQAALRGETSIVDGTIDHCYRLRVTHACFYLQAR